MLNFTVLFTLHRYLGFISDSSLHCFLILLVFKYLMAYVLEIYFQSYRLYLNLRSFLKNNICLRFTHTLTVREKNFTKKI